jgi:cysteinyl-tRNA synthetase
MLNSYHPEVLRLFLLQSHYRSPVDFSEDSLTEARQGMGRFYNTLKNIKDLRSGHDRTTGMNPAKLSGKTRELYLKLSSLPASFVEAMDDDFNTARALGYIFETVRLLNGSMADTEFTVSDETDLVLETAKNILEELERA